MEDSVINDSVVNKSSTITQQAINNFLSDFLLQKEGLYNGLKEAEKLERGSEEMEIFLDSLYKHIESMKKLLADSILFLPSYDIRKSQKTIEESDNLISKARLTLLPKKKFGFKSKKLPNQEVKEKPFSQSDFNESIPPNITTNFVDDDEQNVSNLQSKVVYLQNSVLNSLRIFNLKGCKVYTGAVLGSIFIDDCVECTFSLASQQIRIHNCYKSDFYLYVRSNPIIENCNEIRFGPYNLNFPQIKIQFEEARFDLGKNNWDKVEDFNWLKIQQSPHWSIIPYSERIPTLQLTENNSGEVDI